MKWRTYILIAFLALGACKEAQKEQAAQPESAVMPKEEGVLSTYQDLEGNPIEIEDYKGKRVLINYWATWCRPCIEEMPDLLELQASLAAENYVFLLASDESVKKIEKFKRAKNFEFTFIKYNGIYSELEINALPVTFVYNEAGERVLRFDGAKEWNTPKLKKQLKNL